MRDRAPQGAIAHTSRKRLLAPQAEIASPEFRGHLSRLSFPKRRLASAIIHGTIDLAVIGLVFLKAV